MNRGLSLLAAAAAGAAASYLLDAQEGRRRRARLRDNVYGKLSHLDEAATVPDDVLAKRVRAKLGRRLAHPAAVEVSASQGRITLHGPVLKRELKRALQGVAAVRGVKSVENLLEPHEQAGNVPGLQGGVRRDDLPDVAQRHWSPATRFLVGAGGAVAIAYGISRRSPAAALLAAGGAAMLARAGTNLDMKRLLGWRGRRSVEFQNTIFIDAPREAVYRLWSELENFPKFMRHVRSVQKNRDDTWHWEVAGPLGAAVEWDARITQADPPRQIAWATVPGGNVQHEGVVRFSEEGTGTLVEIRMSYSPMAGALGHLVAWLSRRDPQHEMDEDLMRLKGYFESGKPARDAAQPVQPAL